MNKLTPQKIEATVTNKNLVVRNLQVTLGYFSLSEGMRQVIGDRNVSWVGMATYASKTAGQAIRHELMPKRLKSTLIRAAGYDETHVYLRDELMGSDPDLSPENTSRLAEALRQVSLLVSQGNVMVYAELATPFLAFTTRFRKQWDRDDSSLAGFIEEHLTEGPVEEGGQDHLREAFSAYYQARFETDPKKKAEDVFHGNMLVGLHEQTRLQPYIEKSLTIPVQLIRGSATTTGEAAPDGERGLMMRMARKLGTRMLMSLTFPNRELRLGRDVVAPTGVIRFPPDLITLEDARVIELVEQFDRGLDTLSGSAADNWASLDDRMSFIVDLFRSHQQYKRLFEQPFLDDQVSAIDAGHLPAGPL